ncbi:putative secreted protein with PEP-CTERM sorting signal [Nitrosomonas sp. Nm84]|uniref:FxDxF family PEP-CTERM protein n=1 Tax=Nitrosomonas sp. Nm84 TaxID=200124 RepID=UPI000D75D9B7|nr:FxDxF family PEP-CTERM protein [Nitrosomonas sp. Nm84]PXW86055.1 putative secreted protein with PEP-CTERM sorting signal [Nitrosomonas sp. Nm84]
MQKKHVKKTSMLVSAAIIAIAALTSAQSHAAGAIGFKAWNGDINELNLGGSISAAETGLQSAYSDNPLLNNSAWAHTGDWYTFKNNNLGDVNVTVSGDAGFAPGLTVWATGVTEFDGGTTGFGSELSSAGFETPHTFNATGAMGDAGTLWMASGNGGNVLETLGYAVSGPSHTTAGWGESILTGANDVSLTSTFENGISGSAGANSVSLTFDDLAPGWYALYIGGTENATAGGAFDLTVSAVPEPETYAMLLTGLGFIGYRLRSRRKAPNKFAA